MNTDSLRFLLAAGFAAAALATTAPAYHYIRNEYTGLPIKWPGGTVNLRIMLGSTPVLSDGSNYNTSAQGAAETWNLLLGSISFRSTFATGKAVDRNGINELVFANTIYGRRFDERTLAITTTWRVGNERTEGDVIFDSARTWDSYPGNQRSGVYDVHRVALHELGHHLGLDHPDEDVPPQTVQAIMNSRIGNLDTLTMDDITGAQNLYGPPGPADNDRFANATEITGTSTTGTVTVTGFNTLATKEPLEPNHGGNAGGHSVWWTWTAYLSGSVTVDTRGSYYDTTLGVYTGTGLGNLTTIATNDDINPGIVQASSVTFNATVGTVYYFGVDGYDADTGGIVLNLTTVPVTGTLPTITTQPSSRTIASGGSVTLSVAATAGTSVISYQWLLNGLPLNGATNPTLSLSNVTSANAGTYIVAVSTEAGTVYSKPATLTVTSPVVIPPPAPAPAPSGGGGGGAPSLWFGAALCLLAIARRWSRRPTGEQT